MASPAVVPPLSSKKISQIYKQSSQLFLTRRYKDSLSTVEPLITPPAPSGAASQPQGNGENAATPEPPAPVAMASNNLRVKVWSLYVTLLNAIVDLGSEEGKKEFGIKTWKALVKKVRNGDVWEEVVHNGYRGREGSVDAEVVANLATLLLAHSPSQKLNQQRLESYLSSSDQVDLDMAAHLASFPSEKGKHISRRGANTPKDLTSRIKILEIFIVHILPRNQEWDYAREFIAMSDVLDDDHRDAFNQALDNLAEEKDQSSLRAAELQRQRDEELERQRTEQERAAAASAAAAEKESKANGVHKTDADALSPTAAPAASENPPSPSPNPNAKSRQPGGNSSGSLRSAIKPTRTVPPPPPAGTHSRSRKWLSKAGGPAGAGGNARSPPGTRAAASSKTPFRQFGMLVHLFGSVVRNVARSLSRNPLSVLRSLLMVIGVFMALSRPNVRERLRRVTGAGWNKVAGTVGMGVKVSYI